LLWLPIIIRGKAFDKLLISPGKVIQSNKKQGQFPKVTLENSEKMYFFSFFGDVPKMALAIYMRGEKKVEKQRSEIDENQSKNAS
jgi:hypothetical protein